MSDHTPDAIDYVSLTRAAHMNIVREALRIVEDNGALPGQHYFYISFRTQHNGVRLSDALRERFPQEMTVVIQNQFWDLQVSEDRFDIVLKFSGVPEQLQIPFEAITRFADPDVEFSLIFISLADEDETPTDSEAPETEAPPDPNAPESDTSGDVVSLAAFRSNRE